ncbi:hypothetical protein [Aquimarina pacifica]|uniref:hypothetical protein n=1 Tax=Aquimarina pacifica TaxID=1296415 RepID=UPI0004719EB2|nr:hypothetical protein [Aquimarina pacifica]
MKTISKKNISRIIFVITLFSMTTINAQYLVDWHGDKSESIGELRLNDHGQNTFNAALLVKDYNFAWDQADQYTNRWLIINPRRWHENTAFNDFSEGTYLNSRVAISKATSWFEPKTAIDAILSVDGKIYSEGLKCQLSENWADYVFKADYVLKPLEEVEHYIIEHGHLPNIPSAETVEKEGLDVTNMQVLQMEKIEELTLYMIALQKQNKELQERLSKLELASN